MPSCRPCYRECGETRREASGSFLQPPYAPAKFTPAAKIRTQSQTRLRHRIHRLVDANSSRPRRGSIRPLCLPGDSSAEQRRGSGGKTSQFTLSQPPTLKSLPGGEGGDRDRAEDQEIVRGLDLRALLRPVAVGHERGRADEAEVPAEPEKDEREPEMGDRSGRRGRSTAAAAIRTSPAAVTRSLPKRAISRPVKKLGPNMARMCHWIPSAALPTAWPQLDHRERRGRHQEAHEAVGDEAGDHGDRRSAAAR